MRSGATSVGRRSWLAASRGAGPGWGATSGRPRPNSTRTPPHDSQEAVLAELGAAVSELLTEDIAALGFGVPSPIDQRRGVVVQCVNLPLADIALRDLMAERLGLPLGPH